MKETLSAEAIEEFRAQLAGLFSVPVGVGITDPRAAQLPLMTQEAPAVACAILRRQREFAAGRAAARSAIVQLGGPAAPIPAAPDRAPIWPDGWQGSISHAASICVACAAFGVPALGIDVEEAEPLGEDITTSICSSSELDQIAGPQQGLLAKLIFSAKEAAYKAQYPLTRTLLGFDAIEILLDPDAGQFDAVFLKPAGRFQPGDKLAGRCLQAHGHLVTAVTIGQVMPKGA